MQGRHAAAGDLVAMFIVHKERDCRRLSFSRRHIFGLRQYAPELRRRTFQYQPLEFGRPEQVAVFKSGQREIALQGENETLSFPAVCHF
jgi:predicted ATPase